MPTVTNNNYREWGSGCLLLFGAPFALVSLFCCYSLFSHAYSAARMRGWAEVPMTIEHSELKESQGDDSTSYKAAARYTYIYNGQSFSGDRVDTTAGMDNVDSFQQDKYNEIRSAQSAGRPLTGYVNPADPRESVLFRDFRWSMALFYLMFILTFGMVGFGMIAVGIHFRKVEARERVLVARHPGEPWKHRLCWKDGTIKPNLVSQSAGSAALAVMWNGLAIPAAILFTPQLWNSDHRWALLLVYLFPLVGIGIVIYAVKAALLLRRFHGSYLQLSTFPGRIGGSLQGQIHCVSDLSGYPGALLELRCVRKSVVTDSDGSTTKENVVWRTGKGVPAQASAGMGRPIQIPLDFQIPKGRDGSTWDRSSDSIIWRLVLMASEKTDLFSFDIPVAE